MEHGIYFFPFLNSTFISIHVLMNTFISVLKTGNGQLIGKAVLCLTVSLCRTLMMLNTGLNLLVLSPLLFLFKSISICKSEGELLAVELLYTFQEIGYLLGISLVKQVAWHRLNVCKFWAKFSVAYLHSWTLSPFFIILSTNIYTQITLEHWFPLKTSVITGESLYICINSEPSFVTY